MPGVRRQATLAQACVRPSRDPGARVPGTSHERKGRVQLLGLLAGYPRNEEVLDAGDGQLVLRQKRGAPWVPPKRDSWHPRSLHLRNPPCTPEPDAHPPSFPFQWLWDPSAAGGRGLLLSPPHSPNPHCSPSRLPDQGGRSQGARGRKAGGETFKGGRNRGGRRPQGCGYRGAGSPQGSRGPSSSLQHHAASLSQHLLAEGGAWPLSPRSRRRRWAPRAPPRSVPDFPALHRNIQKQLEQRKTRAKLTDCKPFRLHLPSRGQSHPGAKLGTPRGQLQAQSCPPMFSLLHPVIPTQSSIKRLEATRQRLQSWAEGAWRECQGTEQRQARAWRVQQDVARCLATHNPPGSLAQALQRKKAELRSQERVRMALYKAQLREMEARVSSRPYLFERVMQASARRTVEHRFSQVLEALGIEEAGLWRQAGHQGPPPAGLRGQGPRPTSGST